MALINFDARSVQPDQGFDVLPAGWYKALVEKSDVKPTKDGSGAYVSVEYKIIDGQFSGRKIFGRFNIQNANPMAVEIGYKQLSALAHAVGVLQVQDSSQLHNIPLQIRLKLVPAKDEYEPKNEVTSWKNINEQVGAVTAQPAPSYAPPPVQQAAPPVNQQQPQGNWGQPGAQPPAAPQWQPPQGQPQQPAQQAPQYQAAPPAQQQQQPQWQPPAGAPQWGGQAQGAPVQQAQQQPAGVATAQAAPPPWAQPR